MTLTAGEKLKAKTGAIHTFITQLTASTFFTKIINVKDYRSSYYQMCAQITGLELNGIKDVKFKNLEELHRNDFNPESEKAQQIKKTINFLSRISEYFLDNGNLLSKKSNIAVHLCCPSTHS